MPAGDAASTWPRRSPRREPGLAVGGGVAVTGGHGHPDAGRRSTSSTPPPATSARPSGSAPTPPTAGSRPYAEVAKLVQAMAAGEIEVLVLGTGREPGLHAARRAQGRRGDPQGAVRRQLREPAGRDDRARAPGAARHALAGVVGRLRAARGRAGPDAADDEADPRRARRWATCCWPSGRAALGTEEGKGPLPWATLRAVPQGGVGADREGAVGGDAAAGRRVARRRRPRWR